MAVTDGRPSSQHHSRLLATGRIQNLAGQHSYRFLHVVAVLGIVFVLVSGYRRQAG